MSPDCKILAHAWLHLQPLSTEGNRKLGWDLVLYSNFLWPQSYRYAEWRDLYSATPALTQALGFCRVIQMTMTFYCVFTTSKAYRKLILTPQSVGFDDMLTYFLKSFLSWPCDLIVPDWAIYSLPIWCVFQMVQMALNRWTLLSASLEKFNPTTDLQTWQKLRLLVWVLLSYVKLAFDSVILK